MAEKQCNLLKNGGSMRGTILYQTTTRLTSSLSNATNTNVMSLILPKGTYIGIFEGRRDAITASRIFISLCGSGQISGGDNNTNRAGFCMVYGFTLTASTTVYATLFAEQGGSIGNDAGLRFQAIKID